MPGFSLEQGVTTTPNNNAEFYRNHRWRIVSTGIPPTVAVDPTRERVYAKSVQLPSVTFEEEKLKTGSAINYKIAKGANWQDFTIKFYDVYGLYDVYKQWQDAIWNQTEGIRPPSDYKGQPIIALTDHAGDARQTYTAFGAYPKSITHGDLSYENSEVKLLTVTYTYDYAEITFSGSG
jgi:hypothetical protein